MQLSFGRVQRLPQGCRVCRRVQQRQSATRVITRCSTAGAASEKLIAEPPQNALQTLLQGVLSFWRTRHTNTQLQPAQFYIILLMIRVILSWFRKVDFYKEPWTYLRELTDPYMNIFRGLIPPFGKVDVSPILGFIILQFVQRFFASLAGIS